MSTAIAESALNGSPLRVGPRLLELPEDQWLERKSSRVAAKDLAKALIGFANADGGIVVVGLAEGEVEGVDDHPGRLNALLQANIDFCTPPVRANHRFVACVDGDGLALRLLVFEVDSSPTVHTNQRDEVFLRVGDETRRLTFAQRQELLYDKGQASYEARPSGAGFDALDREQLGYYAEALGATDPMGLLRARGLATDEELTVAGVLLFGEHPQALFPEALIRVLRYRGSERGSGSRQQLIEDVRVEGPIPLQLLRGERSDRTTAADQDGAAGERQVWRGAPCAAGRLARGSGECGGSPFVQLSRRSHSSRDLRRQDRDIESRPVSGAGRPERSPQGDAICT